MMERKGESRGDSDCLKSLERSQPTSAGAVPLQLRKDSADRADLGLLIAPSRAMSIFLELNILAN